MKPLSCLKLSAEHCCPSEPALGHPLLAPRCPCVSMSPLVTSAAVVVQGGQTLALQCGSPLPPTVPLWLPALSQLTACPGGSLPVQTLLCALASPSSWLPRWCWLGACGLHLPLLLPPWV